MLKLYHWWSSTCSRRVRIALAAKQLSWEGVYVNLAKFENLEPWYVELNPNGVVPTLVHDGRIIIESNFILDLDEVEETLQDRPWLTGERMSLADCSIAPFIERFESNKLERLTDWSARPALGAWWARMQATEAYRTAYSFKAPA